MHIYMEIREPDLLLHLILFFLQLPSILFFLFYVLLIPFYLAFPIWIILFLLLFSTVSDGIRVPFLILPDFRFKT